MNYAGGKNSSGAYQNIINLIPPHKIYIEPFLGSGAVWRNKKPALRSYVVEKDFGVLSRIRSVSSVDNTVYVFGDAVEFICAAGWENPDLSTSAGLPHLDLSTRFSDVFIYADPPYLHSTRSNRSIYNYEMSESDHVALLQSLLTTSATVAISGYWSDLYAEMLSGWRIFQYNSMTRGGLRTETVWMNYPEPGCLHDYSFLGSDRSDRQRIKRKIDRWSDRFLSLPRYERQAIMQALSCLQSKDDLPNLMHGSVTKRETEWGSVA